MNTTLTTPVKKLRLPAMLEGYCFREKGTRVEPGDRVPFATRDEKTNEIRLAGWTPAAAIGHAVVDGENYIRRTRSALRK